MARRTFHVIDITEILVHWYAGRSQYELADSLGVDRETIRKYLEPAIAAGFVPPGPPPMSEVDWAELVRFPLLTDTRLRQVTWPEIARHREFIVVQLEAGVSKATIHQRLADEHGLTASLASLKRYVAANLPESALRSAPPERVPHVGHRPLDSGLWTTSSTTPDRDDRYRRVRVTHRFHPLFGRDFEFVAHRLNWGENRVCLRDEDGALFSLPAGWTDVAPVDPFVVVAAGRCPFTTEGLLALAELIDQRGSRGDADAAVKRITP
jgi:hypothetical protein